jgi:hypothetical protein
MKLPRIGRLVAFAVLASALCATGFAQKVTGDITGSVSDASGAVLAGATVTAENTGTGLKRTVTTSGTGVYSIPELPPGTYRMTANASGFKTTSRDASVVAAQTTTSNFGLEVGAQTEVVTVEATAPIIEYTGNLNNSLDNATIAETPLSGRDFQQLVNINPGVVRIPGGGFQSITVNGQREDSNNYFIDGFYNNDRFYGDAAIGETGIVGIPATVIPPEAVQEMTIQQTPSAEFGVKSGAPIITNLKTGTNAFHGDAHWFRHTDATDAANYFAKHDPDSCDASVTDCRSHLKNNQYGGLLSGPIWKDKTFFMAFYEGQRLNFDNPYVAPVPTPAAIAQARADIAAAGLTTNPVGEALLSFYPTDPTGAILTNIPTRAELDEFGVKIDHQFGANQRLSGRYIFADSFQSAGAFTGTVAPPPPNPPDLFNSVAPSRAQIIGVSHFLNIGSNKILESRFGVTRFSQLIDVNNKVNPLDLGINTGPLDPTDFGVPAVYYLGYIYGYIGGVGGYPITTRPNQTYDWSEHFSWIKGNHAMKMGGNFQRARTNSIRNRARTVLNVVNGWDDGDDTTDDTHNSIAQLLLGRFDDVSRTFGSSDRVVTQNSLGFYFQDDWRIRPNLSLSLGLRYDIAGNINEEDNRASNFLSDVGLVQVGSGLDSLYNKDKNNFGPRVGFAWDPWSNGKTAIRGGYALTYDLPLFGAILGPRTGFMPGALAGSFTNPDLGVFPKTLAGDFGAATPTDPTATCVDPTTGIGNFVCVQPGVPIFGANPNPDPPFSVFSIDPNLKTAMIHNFNLSVQQELWAKNVLTVSYVGTQGRDQYAYRDLNAFPVGCSFTVAGCVRPFESQFPDLAHIVQLTNDSKHWYDAMQVQFRQQAWHGLTNQTNFTWSNCRDLNSNSRSSRVNFFQAQNPYNPEDSKGPCDHDQRRKFTNSIVYEVPGFGLGRFGKGWQISSLIQLADGTPFTPNLGSFDPSDQDTHSIRASWTGEPVQYNPRDPDNYIANPEVLYCAACLDPTDPLFSEGTLGNAGRNMLRGPGFAQWDMTLAKATQITERLNLQFRWEVFNVLNRANFGIVNNGVRSSNFGRIFSTPDVDAINPLAEGGPRTMQFALKLRF